MAKRTVRRLTWLAVMILTLGAAALAPRIALAQVTPDGCGERTILLAMIKRDWNEVPIAAGLIDQSVFELLLDADDRSWTVIKTFPEGRSCIILSGEYWIDVTAPEGDPL